MLITGRQNTDLSHYSSISDLLADKTCVQCGAPLQEGWNFCPNCGASVDQPQRVGAGLTLRRGSSAARHAPVGVTRQRKTLTL